MRPWNDEAGGWHRVFLRDPRGAIAVGKRRIPVRAKPARGERLFDAVDEAYAAKYDTKASQQMGPRPRAAAAAEDDDGVVAGVGAERPSRAQAPIVSTTRKRALPLNIRS